MSATLSGAKRKQFIDIDDYASINKLRDPMKIGSFGYFDIDETDKEISFKIYNSDESDYVLNLILGDKYTGTPSIAQDTTHLKVRRYESQSDGGDPIPDANKYYRWEWYRAGETTPSITLYDGRWGPGDQGGYEWYRRTYLDISDLQSVIDGSIQLTGNLKIINKYNSSNYYDMAGDKFQVNADGMYTVQDAKSFYYSWTSSDFPSKIFYTDEGGNIPKNSTGYIWNFYSRIRQYSSSADVMDLYSYKSYLYIAKDASASSAYSFDSYVKIKSSGAAKAYQGEIHLLADGSGNTNGVGYGLDIVGDTPNDGTLYGVHIDVQPTDTANPITGTILGGYFEHGDVKVNDHLILGDSGASKDGYIDLPTGKLNISGYLDITYNNTSGGILLRNQNTTNATSMSWMTDDFQSELTIGVNNSAATTDAHAAYIWQLYAYDLKFGTDNTERMRITSSGQVQISDSLSIAGHTAWHAGNDGSGSGLDADLLDGQEGSHYADYALSNVEDVVILDKIKNEDGPGSGLDADLLDGHHQTDFLYSINRNSAANNLLIDARYNQGDFTQIFYSNNWLCYGDELHGATVEFTDDTGIPANGVSYPERIFITDGSDSYTVLDMSQTPNPLYISVSANFKITTDPNSIRLILAWHGDSGYDNISFQITTNNNTVKTVALWKKIGSFYISEPLGNVIPYNTNSEWPIKKITAVCSTKNTSHDRHVYALMYWAHRSETLPYLLNKSGGTMIGTLNVQDLLPRSGGTYNLGNSSKYYQNLYTNYARINYIYARSNSVIYAYKSIQIRDDATIRQLFSLQSTSSTNKTVYMDFRQSDGNRLGWIGADTTGNITIASDNNSHGTNKIRVGVYPTTEVDIEGEITNRDIIKPVITIGGDKTTRTIQVNIRDNNNTGTTRIGSSARGALHYYFSDSAFGDISAPTSAASITYTINNGNNLTPDNVDADAMNYAITDSNGVFKITINVGDDGDATTFYFHCEINGIMYYTSFTISNGQGGG